MEIPDQIEPILGYRVWRMDSPEMKAMFQDAVWPARIPLQAICSKHGHAPPIKGCQCGIYAYKAPVQVDKEFRPMRPFVYGEVALWGNVKRHHDGYRASMAYPTRFWVYAQDHDLAMPVVQKLGEIYGVPVEIRVGSIYARRPFLAHLLIRGILPWSVIIIILGILSLFGIKTVALPVFMFLILMIPFLGRRFDLFWTKKEMLSPRAK